MTHFGVIVVYTGTSMSPTLSLHDATVASRFVYRSSNPCRGDVIIVPLLKKDGSTITAFKRVVGLPGETIAIRPPYVLINGTELLEPPFFAKMSSGKEGYSGYVTAKDTELEGIELPITLGPDEYFVLGDNSPESGDSRHFGPVPRANIHGKVMRIVFPPWRIREL